MTICQFCGTKLMDGAKFCYKCEKRLEYPDEETGGSYKGNNAEVARIKADRETEADRELDDIAMATGVGGEVAKRKAKYRDVSSLDESAKVSVFTGDRGGPKKRYCSYCDMEISKDNCPLKCMNCGSRFCEHCEAWFRSAERKRGDLPLCRVHYIEEKARIERERREAERKRREEERKKARVKEELTNSIGMKFKLITPGEFTMGSNRVDDIDWVKEHSGPVHKVKISEPFYIGVFPVTQREWKKVMGETPSKFKGDKKPVEKVSWKDCQKFIERLNSMEDTYKYRLPTEAEWESACRSGSTGKYCFGDGEGKLSRYAWYGEDWKKGSTHTVGTKKPNKWGLHDMHGNVWEWCEDRWHENYRGAPSDGSAWLGGDDDRRVVRGGSWYGPADVCASAARYGDAPGRRGNILGVRLARSSD